MSFGSRAPSELQNAGIYLASHADVLRGFVTRSCPTNVRGAGTRDEPLRTSARLEFTVRRRTEKLGNRSLELGEFDTLITFLLDTV